MACSDKGVWWPRWLCVEVFMHHNIHFHSYIHSQRGQGSKIKKLHSSVQNGIYMLRKDCFLSHDICLQRSIASPVNRNRIKSTRSSFSGGLWSGLLKKIHSKIVVTAAILYIYVVVCVSNENRTRWVCLGEVSIVLWVFFLLLINKEH